MLLHVIIYSHIPVCDYICGAQYYALSVCVCDGVCVHCMCVCGVCVHCVYVFVCAVCVCVHHVSVCVRAYVCGGVCVVCCIACIVQILSLL